MLADNGTSNSVNDGGVAVAVLLLVVPLVASKKSATQLEPLVSVTVSAYGDDASKALMRR